MKVGVVGLGTMGGNVVGASKNFTFLFFDFELDRGVDGANTGYAFPDMLVECVRLAKEGRRDAAHDLFDAHLPLLRYEQQQGVGLAVRKYILKRRGAIASSCDNVSLPKI